MSPVLIAPLVLLLAGAAQAQTTGSATVMAILNGGDIAPDRVLTGAWAVAELTIDYVKGEVTVSVDAFNLPTGMTGAHVHLGSPGVVGPVLFDLRPTERLAGDVNITGSVSIGNLSTSTGLGIKDISDAFQSMVGLATYIDIHTEGHGDGEIRGWLGLVSSADSAVMRARRALGAAASLQR